MSTGRLHKSSLLTAASLLVLMACNDSGFESKPIGEKLNPIPRIISLLSTDTQVDGGSQTIQKVDPVSFVFRKNHFTNSEQPGVTVYQPVDLVFAIDMSSSMQDEMNAIKNGAKSLVDALYQRGLDLSIGVVGFIDTQESISSRTFNLKKIKNPNPAIEQANLQSFTNFMNSISIVPNYDVTEGGLLAMQNALQVLSQSTSPNAAKIIVYMTDEVGHNGGAASTPNYIPPRDCSLNSIQQRINSYAFSLPKQQNFKLYYSIPTDSSVQSTRAGQGSAYVACSPFQYPSAQMNNLMSSILTGTSPQTRGGELRASSGAPLWPFSSSTQIVETLVAQLDKDITREQTENICVATSALVKNSQTGETISQWSQTPQQAFTNYQQASDLQLNNAIQGGRLSKGVHPLDIRIERCCTKTSLAQSGQANQCSLGSYSQTMRYELIVE